MIYIKRRREGELMKKTTKRNLIAGAVVLLIVIAVLITLFFTTDINLFGQVRAIEARAMRAEEFVREWREQEEYWQGSTGIRAEQVIEHLYREELLTEEEREQLFRSPVEGITIGAHTQIYFAIGEFSGNIFGGGATGGNQPMPRGPAIRPDPGAEVSIANAFSRQHGVIEIVWLDQDNNAIPEPISPANYLSGMNAVRFEESNNTWVPADITNPLIETGPRERR